MSFRIFRLSGLAQRSLSTPSALRLYSSSSQSPVQTLESELQALPALKTHRSRPDASDWYELRAWSNFSEERKINHLSAGSLRGPGKLDVPPLIRIRDDDSESVEFVHLGQRLCGHDGIIHGGMLAVLMDEALIRTAYGTLPDNIGVTANLALDYRAPTRADQWVLIRTQLASASGRKAEVTGTVEDMDGTRLVDARATFVRPKDPNLKMQLMNSSKREQKT